jgi:TPR repeat protein
MSKLITNLAVLFVLLVSSARPSKPMPAMNEEDLRLLVKVAEKGNPESQFLLGLLYEAGDGFARDKGAAINWFRKAAESGYVEAQYALGRTYADLDPEDSLANPDEAEKWLRQAAEQGNVDAISRLSDYGMKAVRAEAEKGNPEAISRLGALLAKDPVKRRYFTEGEFGRPDPAHSEKLDSLAVKPGMMGEDPDVTANWSRLLSGLRGADAFLVRGWMLENGIFVNRDFTAAAENYRKAAGLGHVLGQYRLGLMYAEGRGVTKDMTESRAWLNDAAASGSVEAMDALAKLKGPPTSEQTEVDPKAAHESSGHPGNK